MWKKRAAYVILQVQSLSPDRFLRRLLLSGIPVADVRHVDETTVRLRIPACDFRRLLPIRRRERCKIRIVERRGALFRMQRLFRRPALWIGLPVCVALLWTFCARIWLIRIDGAVRTDAAEVRALLEEHGIGVGRRPKGNVLILAADDLSARLPEAAWVSLNRDGIVLDVKMQELTHRHEAVDWSVPADIVAKKDATVVSVETRRGKSRVVSGQAVRKGDVLIGGHVMFREDRVSYDTRADGTVTGCCVYTAEADFPQTVTEYVCTGNTEMKRELLVFGIPILRSRSGFAVCFEDDETEIPVARFGVPMTVRRTEVSEAELRERVLSEAERGEQAELYAVTDAIAKVPHDAKICSIHTTVQRDGKRRFVRCTVVTEESIGEIREMKHA